MLKIIEKSCHLRSVHDNGKIYVGIPNCFTIANTSYKNCFQHVKFPLTELINEKALSPETRLSIVLFKLPLNIAAVSVPGLLMNGLLVNGFMVLMVYWCCSYTDLAEKYNMHLMQNTD